MKNNNLLVLIIIVLLGVVAVMYYNQHARKEVTSLDLPGNRKLEITKPVTDNND